MPRRAKPDDLAHRIGERIAQLREQKGLTREKLSYEFGIASKGYISDLERGLARPSVTMLERIADALDVELLDLFVFPDEGDRHRLIDASRSMPAAAMRRVVADGLKRKR